MHFIYHQIKSIYLNKEVNILQQISFLKEKCLKHSSLQARRKQEFLLTPTLSFKVDLEKQSM